MNPTPDPMVEIDRVRFLLGLTRRRLVAELEELDRKAVRVREALADIERIEALPPTDLNGSAARDE